MEWMIGEIKRINGEWYQCVRGVCNGCAFIDQCELCSSMECTSDTRLDKTNVIIKKLEEIGEPYSGHDPRMNKDILVQDYKLHMNCAYCDAGMVDWIAKSDVKKLKITIKVEDPEIHEVDPVEITDSGVAELPNEGMDEKVNDIPRISNSKMEEVKSNLKPFDLKAAMKGDLVCTRDGKKVRIICYDKQKDIYPIIALVTDKDGYERLVQYDDKGKVLFHREEEMSNDLMMIPKVKEGWVNVYKSEDQYNVSTLFGSEEFAKKQADSDCVATIRLEWRE